MIYSFEEYCVLEKNIQIKRKYTDKHPGVIVRDSAAVRNAVLELFKDKEFITELELKEFLKTCKKKVNEDGTESITAAHPNWYKRNENLFMTKIENETKLLKLSDYGKRIFNKLTKS